jgi:hypothetical protein
MQWFEQFFSAAGPGCALGQAHALQNRRSGVRIDIAADCLEPAEHTGRIGTH